MNTRRAVVRRAFPCVLLLAGLMACVSLTGCGAGTAADAAEQVDPRFATAEALVEHINSLASDGLRIYELSPLIYAETPFQQDLDLFFEAIAGSESLVDATIERFGEPLDEGAGDLRIALGFEAVGKISEESGRAEAAVLKSSGDLQKILLVQAGERWWVSGYTWEYAWDDARKAELPDRSLTYQVDATIAPPLLRRLQAGEFASIDQLRAAHHEAILSYFEANPAMFERITGKPFRRQ